MAIGNRQRRCELSELRSGIGDGLSEFAKGLSSGGERSGIGAIGVGREEREIKRGKLKVMREKERDLEGKGVREDDLPNL